jgi:hypothetical protein
MLTVSLVLADTVDLSAPEPPDVAAVVASQSDLFPPTVLVGPDDMPLSWLCRFERYSKPLPRGCYGSDARYMATLERYRNRDDDEFSQRLSFRLLHTEG